MPSTARQIALGCCRDCHPFREIKEIMQYMLTFSALEEFSELVPSAVICNLRQKLMRITSKQLRSYSWHAQCNAPPNIRVLYSCWSGRSSWSRPVMYRAQLEQHRGQSAGRTAVQIWEYCFSTERDFTGWSFHERTQTFIIHYLDQQLLNDFATQRIAKLLPMHLFLHTHKIVSLPCVIWVAHSMCLNSLKSWRRWTESWNPQGFG